MNAPYFIELLSRSGELKSRHRFDHLPIRIGRGYQNDLILDDPYVAAQHASVDLGEDGVLHVRDLGSQNGILFEGKRQSQITPNDHVLRLGHTNLRIRSAAFNVNKELADNNAYDWEGKSSTLLSILAIALSSLISVWLDNTEKFSTVSYLLTTALVFAIVVTWCGGWAFANRVISGQSRFTRHLLIAACAIVVLDVWGLLNTVFSYAFALEFLTLYSSHISLAICAGMVFFHLITISNQHRKTMLNICVILTLVGSGLILMVNYQRSGKFADELYMAQILPPALHLSADQSVDAFLHDAQSLKSALDKAHLEPANHDDLLGSEY